MSDTRQPLTSGGTLEDDRAKYHDIAHTYGCPVDQWMRGGRVGYCNCGAWEHNKRALVLRYRRHIEAAR